MINFAKLQATGNDFILIDARGTERNWAQLSRNICHRHLGVGADGLILLRRAQGSSIKMRIFNSDGSEAEVCGNGLRCLAKFVIDRQIASGTKVMVETLSGRKTIEASIEDGEVTWARVNMGLPLFGASDIPVLIKDNFADRDAFDIRRQIDYPLEMLGHKLTASFVSLGNPHAVIFVTRPVSEFPLAEIGPAVENHPMFPQKTNVEIAGVINREKIEARVWERGVGETLSCGSGACAIGVTSKLKGYTGGEVDIILQGGTLAIEWDGIGDVHLSGPVKEVFTGEWKE